MISMGAWDISLVELLTSFIHKPSQKNIQFVQVLKKKIPSFWICLLWLG